MASKNNLKPKAYAKNNIDRWGYLTGHELNSLTEYTRDQLRAIAYKYDIPNASRKTAEEVINLIKKSDGYKKSSPKQVYKTIFEKIKEQSGGEPKSIEWYRGKLKALTATIKSEPSRMNQQEKFDSIDNLINQDKNENRRRVYPGHMYFFDYEAETKYLPYYDKYPMVYVLKVSGSEFYGANLHYLHPKKRAIIIEKLRNNQIDIPRKIIHKYLNKRCKSLFLDLAKEEWLTASYLPVEDFVLMKGGGKQAYPKEYVWEEMDQYWTDRIKGTRIIKGKTPQDKQRVT